MRFEIKTKEVKEYVRKMSSLVPNISALPHESGILITVEDTKITFRSRNEFVSLKLETNDINNFKIEETGSVLIKGKMLNEIISKMDGNTIQFTKIDKNILFIKSDDSEYEINLLNEENYEVFDINYSVEEGNEFIVKAKNFKDAIQKVMPAVPENHQRKILQGINVVAEEGKVSFTSTNGIRIHRSTIDLPGASNINKTLNIKAIKEILKVLSDNKEARFKVTDANLIIEDKELTIKTKLIEGVYPDVSKPFAMDFNKELKISKEVFLELLERTTVLSQNNEKGIVRIIINHGELSIESREIEIGYSSVKTNEFKFDFDERFEISISPKFLLEAVKAVDGKKLKIDFTDQEKPLMVWSEDSVSFQAIVLPYKRG